MAGEVVERTPNEWRITDDKRTTSKQMTNERTNERWTHDERRTHEERKNERRTNKERQTNNEWMKEWRTINERTMNNERLTMYDVAWLITLAKTMSWVLERLRSRWRCHRSCDDNVAKLREIALATMMSRGLLISWRQCRRDDNNNGNDNDNKNARIKQRGEWQWQCRWWRWCNNQTLREQ